MGENDPVYNSSGTSICKMKDIYKVVQKIWKLDLATKMKEMKLMTQMI